MHGVGRNDMRLGGDTCPSRAGGQVVGSVSNGTKQMAQIAGNGIRPFGWGTAPASGTSDSSSKFMEDSVFKHPG